MFVSPCSPLHAHGQVCSQTLTHSHTHGASNQRKGDSFHAARGGGKNLRWTAPHLRCHLVTKLRQEGPCNSGNDAAVVCGVRACACACASEYI